MPGNILPFLNHTHPFGRHTSTLTQTLFIICIQTVIKWFREVGIVQIPRETIVFVHILYILINMWGINSISFQAWWVWLPICFKHCFKITSCLNTLSSLWSVPGIKWIIINLQWLWLIALNFKQNIIIEIMYTYPAKTLLLFRTPMSRMKTT